YLALTFGTLLSSQGTDTSFGPPSSGPSGRFVRISSLPDVFRSVFRSFIHPILAGQVRFLRRPPR
ncbi:hypothetical protein ACIBJD_28155, partial [Kitasatospora sp. NPDC050467]|uniref:hypothetical protein n=1 Tax=Kitasatospora sp. NPDC050467 TaxID=3364053 RepID=UPI0037B84736